MKSINAIKIHRQNSILWITVLTTGIVCAMFYTFYIWLSMAERYAPLVDAAMEIKLEATTAHLWFEEIISGDPYLTIEEVWEHLDQAEWYARAMLEGGENEEGKYVPLEAPALRHKIEDVLKGISTFRAIAQKRWALQSQSGVGSNIDQLFDSTFDDFLISADDVETVLQRTMENQFQQFRVVQALLIALIIILGSRIGLLLLRHERRHTNDMLVLQNNEEILRETSERFRAAFADAAIGMALASLEHRIIEANQAFCNMLGYSKDELEGVYIKDITHPDDVELSLDHYQKLIAGENNLYQFEKRYLHKQGHVIWGFLSVSLVRDKDATPLYAVAQIQDITERKRIEEALRTSEARFRDLVNLLPQTIYEADMEGNITYVNDVGLSLFGTITEDISGKTNIQDFVIPDERKRGIDNRQKILQGEMTTPNEYTMLKKDGSVFPGIVYSSPIVREGKVIGIRGLVADITKHKQAEEALLESESKYRTLYEQSADAMLIIEEDKFVDCNSATVKMLGYTSKNELLEIHPSELSPEIQADGRNSLEKANEMMSIAYAQGSHRFEWDHNRQNGEVFPVEVLLTAIPFGERNVLQVVWRDITERKRAEEALQTIAEGVSGAVGDTFFNFLVKYLAETLEVEYAFVGELIPENNKRIRTIAVHGHGKTMENFEYDLAGTPCENVVGKQFCIHEKGLQKKFPDDQLLIDMGVESYAGGPLFDSNGRPIGIIVVLSSQPFKHLALAESLLRILGIRCAAEFERKQAENDLQQYQMQLRTLASEIIIAEEQERRRISIELHDNIIQDLGLCKIKLGELVQRLSADDCLPLAEVTRVLIEQTIRESRLLVFDLSLPILYDLGLEEAIKWLAEQTEKKFNISCVVQDDGQPKPMKKEMKVLLYKATRELMANVTKHAHAKKVNISIHRVNDRIDISVQDDGVGFDSADIESSSREALKFGLFGIKERLNLMSGFVKISSLPDSGTTITLTAPLELDH